MTHRKKCWPEMFHAVKMGEKFADVRLDDSNYQVGDEVIFEEYRHEDKIYTGSWVKCYLTHVMRSFPGIVEGYCVLSLGLTSNYSGFNGAIAGKTDEERVKQ